MQLISPSRGERVWRREETATRSRRFFPIRGDTLRQKDENHRASSCRCSISEATRNIAIERGIKLRRLFLRVLSRLTFNWLIGLFTLLTSVRWSDDDGFADLLDSNADFHPIRFPTLVNYNKHEHNYLAK